MPVGSAAAKPRKRSTRTSSVSVHRSSLSRRTSIPFPSIPQDSMEPLTIVTNDHHTIPTPSSKDDASTYAKGISYHRHRSTPFLRLIALSLILFSGYGITRILQNTASSSSDPHYLSVPSSESLDHNLRTKQRSSSPNAHSTTRIIPFDTDGVMNNDEGTSSTLNNVKILPASSTHHDESYVATSSSTEIIDTLPQPSPSFPGTNLPIDIGKHTELVFWYSWLTAMSTGLGVLPFLFHRIPSSYVLGVANAVASGMMLSASIRLGIEGMEQNTLGTIILFSSFSVDYSILTVILGLLGGIGFMYVSQRYLDTQENLKFSGFSGLDAQKIVLILSVMTLHSATEGIGIGVSFGTKDHHSLSNPSTTTQGTIGPSSSSHAETFGEFISIAMAIHNIPEGLATALVLIPRGSSLTETFLWTIFTSLPQPLLAVPSFISVTYFLPLLSLGLGFAAGAMIFVSVKELIPEAMEEIGKSMTYLVLSIAGVTMWSLQNIFDPD